MLANIRDASPVLRLAKIAFPLGSELRILALVLFSLVCPSFAFADPVVSIRYLDASGVERVQTTGATTSADTPFAIASIGKTMTSVAILRQVQKSRINLDDAASTWLPQSIVHGFSGMSGVTVRQLLTMTSGLPDYLDDAYIEDALRNPKQVQLAEIAVRYAFDYPALFSPGKRFDYSNTNYVLLGLILESATGLDYAEAIQQEVFSPSGMKSAFVFGSKALPAGFPSGHEDSRHYRQYYSHNGFGDGGVISSARDLAKFYRALFTEGTLLPPHLMDELLHDPLGENYGMGIELEDGLVGHSGGDLGFASDVRMDVHAGTIAIVLSADANADTYWTFDILN